MKLWMSLFKILLLVITLCRLHDTICEAYATISNRSSSYDNSFSREWSHVEQAKQAAGIYYARNYPTNKVQQKRPTESNSHIKTISAQEYAAMVGGFRWLPQEQAQQKEIQNTFNKQLPQLDAVALDTQELDALYQEYDPEKHTYLEKRLVALKDVQTNTISYSTQSYKLNTDVIDTLHAYGINKDTYVSIYGNKLQQAIHQECIAILEKAAQLSISSPIYEYKPTLIDCIESARAFNQQGSVSKAIRITNFCWSLLDYGKAIVEGVAAGIVGAVQDIIEHPVQTMLSLVIGEYILAYNLGKVLVEVGQIGVLAFIDKNQAKQKLDDYLDPMVQIIKAIEKEEINLRDAIKGTTQFAAGFYAQSKLLGGLGKFYKGIEAKARTFINKNPLLNPEHYLATPDGLLFNVANSNIKSSSKGALNGEHLKKKTRKGVIKKHQLPTKGKIRYVPPKMWRSTERLPQKSLPDNKIGYIDKFDNIWVKGKSRTQGQSFEWDVQLSSQGKKQLGWMTRDNTHLNVSLDGKVTHK